MLLTLLLLLLRGPGGTGGVGDCWDNIKLQLNSMSDATLEWHWQALEQRLCAPAMCHHSSTEASSGMLEILQAVTE